MDGGIGSVKKMDETDGAPGTEGLESAESTPDLEDIRDILGMEDGETLPGGEKTVSVSDGNAADWGGAVDTGFFALAVVGAVVLIIAFIVALFHKRNIEREDKVQAPETSAGMGCGRTEEIMAGQQTYLVGRLHSVGRRETQQDSFAVSDVDDAALCRQKGIIVIVADGMGGLADGEKISSLVTLSFFRHFHERPIQGNAGNELLQMLGEANREVNRYLGDKVGQCGSTLVAGIVKANRCYWISVGDSHIYLYQNSGLMQLNREHIYREELDIKAANGEISGEEALKNPQRGALTSYIGMGRIEKVDRNQEPLILRPGDRLLFMTDGVFGTLSEAQIAEAMRYPVEESIRLMDESIRAVGKPRQDNYTAVILECR